MGGDRVTDRSLVQQSTSKLVSAFKKHANMETFNQLFRIHRWSPESQLLFYMFLKGIFFWGLTFLLILPSWVCFINLLFDVFLCCFIFTRSDQKFNVTLLLVVFFGLTILFTPMGQMAMSLGGTDGFEGDGEMIYYSENDAYAYIYYSPAQYEQWAAEHPVRIETGNFRVKLSGALWHEYTNATGAWVATGETYATEEAFWAAHGETMRFALDNGLNLRYLPTEDIYEEYWMTTSERTGYYYTSTTSWHNIRKRIQIDLFGSPAESLYTDVQEILRDNAQYLFNTPFSLENIDEIMETFMDVLNMVFLLAISGYGASQIGDFFTGRWGNIAKKSAQIALATGIYTAIISLFGLVGIEVKGFWDSAGDTIENIFDKIGLSMLDARGEVLEVSPRTMMNGIFRWLPLVVPILWLGMAWGLRKLDLSSVLFARKLKDAENVVKPSKFKVSVLAIILVFIIYIVGYMLINTDVGYDPLMGLTFVVGSVVVLLLVGNGTLILNEKLTVGGILKWTLIGYAGLVLYFQFAQPAMMELGMRDSYNDALYLAQGASILDHDLMKQLFLVAAPETLIFQVAWLGVWNRVYYQVRKGRFQDLREIEAAQRRLALVERKIRLSEMLQRRDATQRQKLNVLVDIALVEQEIENLEVGITPEVVPHRWFILPSLVSGLGGSFLFSDYHRFRRGISFTDWWRANEGVAFMGAGYWLCLVALFNMWAAIAVHWINNVMVLFLAA
jgi:hypothetical protein